MKTIKKQIKTIVLLFVLMFGTNIYAQKETINTGAFVRVYNLESKKINKGKLISASDTLLTLKRNSKFIYIASKDIGYIKTKHSAGNNILMGSIIGGVSMAILGAASADPDAWILGYTATEGAIAGALFGGTTGAAIGGITILFKNSKTYMINGEESSWKIFQQIAKNK